MSDLKLHLHDVCKSGGYHDFAVGPYHAICNRCLKVVVLGAGLSGREAVSSRDVVCAECFEFLDDPDQGCDACAAMKGSS